MGEALWEIIKTYGWFVGTFVVILIILGKFVFQNYRRWFLTKHKPEDVLQDEIESDEISSSHPFFNDQYRILKVEIPNLELTLNQPVREKLFKDLLYISFNTVYEAANNIVKDKNLTHWTSQQWMNNVSYSINSILKTTEEKAREAEIPDVVVRKFLKWQVESVESLEEYILLLGNSKLYSSNISKTNTFLLILNLMLVTVLGDSERTLGEINGELSGLKYKGLIVE